MSYRTFQGEGPEVGSLMTCWSFGVYGWYTGRGRQRSELGRAMMKGKSF
jgi:hypothetical protein